MFKNEYQGGPYLDVFSAQGREPISKKCRVVGNSSTIKKLYDKEVKSYVYTLEGEPTSTKIHLPKDDKQTLGLLQKFVVLQVFVPKAQPFSFELTVSDLGQNKRRIFLSLNQKDITVTPLHAKFPLTVLCVGAWLNLCIDLDSLVENTFNGQKFKSLENITVTANCRLRRIFTLKIPPADNSGCDDVTVTYATTEVLPKACHLSTTSEQRPITQILNYSRLAKKKANEIQVNNEVTMADHDSLTHIAFGSKVVIPSHVRKSSGKDNQDNSPVKTARTSRLTTSKAKLATSSPDLSITPREKDKGTKQERSVSLNEGNENVVSAVAMQPRPPKTSSAGKVRRAIRVKPTTSTKGGKEETKQREESQKTSSGDPSNLSSSKVSDDQEIGNVLEILKTSSRYNTKNKQEESRNYIYDILNGNNVDNANAENRQTDDSATKLEPIRAKVETSAGKGSDVSAQQSHEACQSSEANQGNTDENSNLIDSTSEVLNVDASRDKVKLRKGEDIQKQSYTDNENSVSTEKNSIENVEINECYNDENNNYFDQSEYMKPGCVTENTANDTEGSRVSRTEDEDCVFVNPEKQTVSPGIDPGVRKSAPGNVLSSGMSRNGQLADKRSREFENTESKQSFGDDIKMDRASDNQSSPVNTSVGTVVKDPQRDSNSKKERPRNLELLSDQAMFTFSSAPRSPRSAKRRLPSSPNGREETPEVVVSLVDDVQRNRGASLEDDFCRSSDEEVEDDDDIQKLLKSSLSPRNSPQPEQHQLRQSIRSSMLKEIPAPVLASSYDAYSYQDDALNQSNASSWRFDQSDSSNSFNNTGQDLEDSLNVSQGQLITLVTNGSDGDEYHSDDSGDTSLDTWRAPPQELRGNKYQHEMKPPGTEPDLTATISISPRDYNGVLSPLMNQQTPGGTHKSLNTLLSPGGMRQQSDEEELDLLYDPILNCYFDPKTHKYYELA